METYRGACTRSAPTLIEVRTAHEDNVAGDARLGGGSRVDAQEKNGRELDRIVFFSDAVFAIAMTLLVLDIQVPEIPESLVAERLPERLLALWPKYLSYVLSFLVILMYWIAHHSTFKAIKRYDKPLIC